MPLHHHRFFGFCRHSLARMLGVQGQGRLVLSCVGVPIARSNCAGRGCATEYEIVLVGARRDVSSVRMSSLCIRRGRYIGTFFLWYRELSENPRDIT